jgi:hypothetical protein
LSQSISSVACELFLYACEIKETTNGRRRGARGQAGEALEVVTERAITQNGKVDEPKPVAEAREDEAQETAEEKATIKRSEAVRSRASAFFHCRHRLPQRLQAHPACPGKGVVKNVDQKQNRREHYRECSGNQVLRPDVFHSKEKRVGDGEYAANK